MEYGFVLLAVARPSSDLMPAKGVFLGFLPGTTKNILWYHPETARVKIAKHARFDEGMDDLPSQCATSPTFAIPKPFPTESNE